MTKYAISETTTSAIVYHVEAESEEEALTLVENGDPSCEEVNSFITDIFYQGEYIESSFVSGLEND